MVLAASAWLTPAPVVRAQEVDTAKVLKVKAAYLYNFAKFVEWPDGAFENGESPFVIGVLGDDPFGRDLDATVKGKTIAKRAVKVRRLRWDDQVDRAQLKDCHILYIGGSEPRRFMEIVAALEDQPVLLVADIAGFAHDGGMIGFVLDGQRIVFEINREAVDRAQLKASARLLKLARIVEPHVRGPKKSRTVKGES